MDLSILKKGSSGELDPVKIGIGIVIIVLFGLLAAYSVAPGYMTSENKPIVVATSSNLGYFAEGIGGEEVEVRTIVSPGACPGHYGADTSWSDVNTVADADLVLWNGMETWVKDLIDKSGNEDAILNKAPTGPWGPPWGAKKYIENTTNALISVCPQYENMFKERENKLISKINSCADNLKDRAAEENVDEVKVICQQFQQGFVKWLGFQIEETYSSPDSLNRVQELIDIAKNENVDIIVSNNPGGTDVGKEVASSTGVEHVVLSNFPGSREDTYLEMIRSNAERLFSAKEA